MRDPLGQGCWRALGVFLVFAVAVAVVVALLVGSLL